MAAGVYGRSGAPDPLQGRTLVSVSVTETGIVAAPVVAGTPLTLARGSTEIVLVGGARA